MLGLGILLLCISFLGFVVEFGWAVTNFLAMGEDQLYSDLLVGLGMILYIVGLPIAHCKCFPAL